MPKHVIISKLGGPEVLEYEEYSLPNEIKVNEVRIKQSSIGLNYIYPDILLDNQDLLEHFHFLFLSH